MKAEYEEAAATQLRWLRWSGGKSLPPPERGMTDPSIKHWASNAPRNKWVSLWDWPDYARTGWMERAAFERPLRDGDLVYVAPGFCRLLATAVKTLPNMTLTDDLFFTENAFVWFEMPVPLPERENEKEGDEPLMAHAMGWSLLAGVPTFSVYQAWVPMQGDPTVGFLPRARFAWKVGQHLDERIAEAENNMRQQPNYIGYRDPSAHEVKYAAVLLNMLNDKVPIITRQGFPRSTRKRLEKESEGVREPISEVKVIKLRRFDEEPDFSGKPAEPNPDWEGYSHRFPVDGHWRAQFYPSRNAHIPKWIMPYVKGPEDKPFIDKRRIFTAVR
jgi:hypothetical protein